MAGQHHVARLLGLSGHGGNGPIQRAQGTEQLSPLEDRRRARDARVRSQSTVGRHRQPRAGMGLIDPSCAVGTEGKGCSERYLEPPGEATPSMPAPGAVVRCADGPRDLLSIPAVNDRRYDYQLEEASSILSLRLPVVSRLRPQRSARFRPRLRQGRTPISSPMRRVAFRPPPVSTTTVVSPARMTPPWASFVSAAAAMAEVGST